MNRFLSILNPLSAVRALESFASTNLHMFVELINGYFLATKFAFLRLKLTRLFMFSKPKLHLSEIAELAFDHGMLCFLVIFLVSLWHTHTASGALEILTSTPHGVHSEFGRFNVLSTNFTQFGLGFLFHLNDYIIIFCPLVENL